MSEDFDFEDEGSDEVEAVEAKPVSAARAARLEARAATARAFENLVGRSGLSDDEKAEKLSAAREELQAALDALAAVA